jgi:hypothetical protein
MPSPSQNQELQQFLNKVGLGSLLEGFLGNGLLLQDLAGLTPSDLKDHGVTKARDRKRVRTELERLGIVKEAIDPPQLTAAAGLAHSGADCKLGGALEEAGLGECLENFTNEGVEMGLLHLLTDEDLVSLGIDSLSKRLKFRSLLEGLKSADGIAAQPGSDRREEPNDHRPRRNFIKCLSCSRMSRSGARTCKYCGKALSQPSGVRRSSQSETKSQETSAKAGCIVALFLLAVFAFIAVLPGNCPRCDGDGYNLVNCKNCLLGVDINPKRDRYGNILRDAYGDPILRVCNSCDGDWAIVLEDCHYCGGDGDI